MKSEQINIEVRKPLEWSRTLKIKVSAERIESEREKIVHSIRKKAKIPGFRLGKAPVDLVNRHYRAEIEGETIETVIHRAIKEAMEKEDLNPITRASVSDIKYDEDKALEFEASFDIQPEIDLQRYTSFKIERERLIVEDGEVDDFIKNLMIQRSTFHPIDRPAEDGNLVTIDYAPVNADNVPLDKQTVTGIKVLLGKGTILPDIESALYGKKAMQNFTVKVTYPDDYHREELRGTERNFHVMIKSVEERKIPVLNDDFVQSFGEFEDVESFRRHIQEEILRQREGENQKKVEDALIDNIIDANPFEVPQSMVNAYVSEIKKNFEGQVMATEGTAKVDAQIQPIAEREVKKNFIIDIILKKEGLEPKAEEIEKEVDKLAVDLKKDPQEFKSTIMGDPESYHTIHRRVARKKVFDYLVENSEITTV